jgi:hypothetical protein
MVVAGLALAMAVSVAGEALARGGRGAGGAGGQGMRNQGAAAASATRPEDSQRRDGTFLSTGTTANGSTTRPGNGRGLQDGSRLSAPATSTDTATTPAQ